MERKLKIALIWAYPQDYLTDVYHRLQGLESQSYSSQQDQILGDYFGWPPSVAVRMKEQGHETRIFVVNAETLQRAWARENSFVFPRQQWDWAVSLEQIRRFQPDVIWIGSMFRFFGEYLAQARKSCSLVAAWVACPIPGRLRAENVDLFLTSHASIGKRLAESGKPVSLVLPSFEKRILEQLTTSGRAAQACFVGSLLWAQRRRIDLLRELQRQVPLELYIAKPKLSRGSLSLAGLTAHLSSISLHLQSKGAAYGMPMYQILANSQLTINVHGEVAGGEAGNIRMFEATGAGSTLVTEMSPNMEPLFEPDAEVVTYESETELCEKVRYLLDNPAVAAGIAAKGQARTLRSHNSEIRAAQIASIFTKALQSSRSKAS